MNERKTDVNLDGVRIDPGQADRVERTLRDINDMLASVCEHDARLYARLLETWQRSIDTLKRFNAVLYSDSSPYSFTWSGCGMFGGLIFHGAGENYTVHLDSNFVGWSLHT